MMSDRLDAMFYERYRVETVIATTGLSVVYVATDLVRSREVIVKMARQGQCGYDKHCLNCLYLTLEATLLRRLDRHTITAPRYLGHMHAGGRPVLVMTKVPGQTLEALHDEGNLSPHQALRYILQVCVTVRELHAIGYVHHDIKPANIIICSDHSAVLIDWGSAQRIRAPGDPRSYGTYTPRFVSPEQVRGEALPGNDIFALGMTLDTLVRWPSRRLEAIIRKATAPPSRRYVAVDGLLHDIARLTVLDTVAGLLDLTAI
jgi:serine/threonine protein kinase